MKRYQTLFVLAIIISMVGCGIVDPNQDLSVDSDQDKVIDNPTDILEVDVRIIIDSDPAAEDELRRPGDWDAHPILARPVKQDVTS
jgi:hypothetical protein